MQFVLTYEDVKLWSLNFFGIELQLEYIYETRANMTVVVPAKGICKLLPHGYGVHQEYLSINKVEPTSFTVYVHGANGPYEELLDLFSRYVNYHLYDWALVEHQPVGRLKILVSDIWEQISLQSLKFTQEGVMLEFDEYKRLYDELKTVQLLLRSGYTHVHVRRGTKEHLSIGFTDDILDYSLALTDHPADMRLSAHYLMPAWLDEVHRIKREDLPEDTPNLHIFYECNHLVVSIPLTIVEPEINASTLAYNCQRLQEHMSQIFWYIIEQSAETEDEFYQRTYEEFKDELSIEL